MSRAAQTEARLVDQRARGRATQALINNHRDEYEQLLIAFKAQAIEELELLPAPEVDEHHPTRGAQPVRLKTGPRKEGETASDRVDVGTCRFCITYHDAGHRCERCGARPKLAFAAAYKEIHRLYDAGTTPEMIAINLRVPLEHVHRLLEEPDTTPRREPND
jgi:hypothetical protein